MDQNHLNNYQRGLNLFEVYSCQDWPKSSWRCPLKQMLTTEDDGLPTITIALKCFEGGPPRSNSVKFGEIPPGGIGGDII